MFLLKCFLVNACKGGISPGGVVRKKRMQRFGLTTDRTAPNPAYPLLQVDGCSTCNISPSPNELPPCSLCRGGLYGRPVGRKTKSLFFWSVRFYLSVVCGRPLTLPVRPCQWFTSEIH